DITEVKDYSASIKWSSNIETDSTVIFTNTKTLESRTQGDAKFVLDHKIDLTNLSPGTEYVIKIEGRDIFGNMAKSSDIKIVTLIDNIPPKIDNIRTDVSISSSKKGKTQLVVVWKTDEPATSQIVLYESGNEENRNNSSTFDSNLTTKHTSVFTNLNAGTVYRFKVESADKAGNLAESGEFVVLTPKNRKSILQIILDIIEKTFGWTRNL
ncbi:fibronectin type III domain-containing protein, partial [Candidatus Parcubacteria bacterium]|nr:fibronectin type III domain-containing protein [Candidatus Parcubacteria bacterium]